MPLVQFLSSMQLARGIVESYPHLVDHLLICNIIAAETRGVQAVPLEGKQGVGIKTEGAAPGDMAADELTQLLKRQPNGHLLMPIGCSFRTLTDAPHMPYSAPPPGALTPLLGIVCRSLPVTSMLLSRVLSCPQAMR